MKEGALLGTLQAIHVNVQRDTLELIVQVRISNLYNKYKLPIAPADLEALIQFFC